MSYYKRWGLFIGTRYFQKHLQKWYKEGIADLRKLSREAQFDNKDFTCLLCGVGNEETARSFVEFVLARNPNATIYIIDLGKEQITAVERLVSQNFPNSRIIVKQMDALDLLTFFKPLSIDWIETDGFLEFFSDIGLQKLLKIWHTTLKEDGFITIREPASKNIVGYVADNLRINGGKYWLGVTLYKHRFKDLDRAFKTNKFIYTSSATIFPTYKKFTLVKQ